MEPKPRSLPIRILSSFWHRVDQARRVTMNVIFIAIPVVVVVVLIWGGPKVPRGGALVVEPKGEIVEQLSGLLGGSLLDRATRDNSQETLLKDLLDAIKAAKDDTRIGSIYLELSKVGPSGLTKIEEIREAILDFRKSGKKVVAYADEYNQYAYGIAVSADEVWLHPQGLVMLEGFGRWRSYY